MLPKNFHFQGFLRVLCRFTTPPFPSKLNIAFTTETSLENYLIILKSNVKKTSMKYLELADAAITRRIDSAGKICCHLHN